MLLYRFHITNRTFMIILDTDVCVAQLLSDICCITEHTFRTSFRKSQQMNMEGKLYQDVSQDTEEI